MFFFTFLVSFLSLSRLVRLALCGGGLPGGNRDCLEQRLLGERVSCRVLRVRVDVVHGGGSFGCGNRYSEEGESCHESWFRYVAAYKVPNLPNFATKPCLEHASSDHREIRARQERARLYAAAGPIWMGVIAITPPPMSRRYRTEGGSDPYTLLSDSNQMVVQENSITQTRSIERECQM